MRKHNRRAFIEHSTRKSAYNKGLMNMTKLGYTITNRRGELITQYPLYLPAGLMTAIKQAAQARRCTVASIVRQALAIGLPRLGTDLPVAAPNADEKGGSNANVRRIVQ